MITIEEAKALPQAIINHACNYLSIDETSIRIVFAPKVEPLYGVPQYATVLNDDTIVIAEDFLALCCKKGFTMLRDELYRRLRFIAKRREAMAIWIGLWLCMMLFRLVQLYYFLMAINFHVRTK